MLLRPEIEFYAYKYAKMIIFKRKDCSLDKARSVFRQNYRVVLHYYLQLKDWLKNPDSEVTRAIILQELWYASMYERVAAKWYSKPQESNIMQGLANIYKKAATTSIEKVQAAVQYNQDIESVDIKKEINKIYDIKANVSQFETLLQKINALDKFTSSLTDLEEFEQEIVDEFKNRNIAATVEEVIEIMVNMLDLDDTTTEKTIIQVISHGGMLNE